LLLIIAMSPKKPKQLRTATVRVRPESGSVLLVTDIQNDFCPGGALAVPEGDRIIPLVNAYVASFHKRGLPIVASRDWHPPGHCSFTEQGGPWPVHCVQGSWGAEFHTDLNLPPGSLVISKATDPNREAYSAFEGTAMDKRLQELGAQTLYVTGLATDYCVKNTVLDGLKRGFRVVVLTDAIRGIDAAPRDSQRALEAMQEAGAVMATAPELDVGPRA
jgi:nicotinamidase/pyrazinamidase